MDECKPLPRSLLTTRVASASPVMSSAMMSNGSPPAWQGLTLVHFSDQRKHILCGTLGA